jgi:hypothetical protein
MKPPGKWHLARVGLVTALFGLGSGWMLFSRPAPPEVRVAGANRLSLACPGLTLAITRATTVVPVAGSCTLEAGFPDGTSATATVRVTLDGLLVCERAGDTLRCASS